MKAFAVLSLVLLAIGAGCQSSGPTSHAGRRMYIAGPSTPGGGRLLPRDKFTKGESPVIVIAGYGNQTVLLEIVYAGRLVASKEFVVPGPQTYERDVGLVFSEHFGTMRPVRRTEFVSVPGGTTITLPPPPLGFYQVTLKLNGVPVESVRFSVLGTGAQ